VKLKDDGISARVLQQTGEKTEGFCLKVTSTGFVSIITGTEA